MHHPGTCSTEQRQLMHSSGIETGYKLEYHLRKMKHNSFMFTDNQAEGVVYYENNKGPTTEP